MSRVPYTVNVDEYICSELERIRSMTKTLDFSLLPAIIERVQFHASSMENAIYDGRSFRDKITRILNDTETAKTDTEILNEIREYVQKNNKKVRGNTTILLEDE